MSGSNDFARVESFTRSGTGAGIGGAKSMLITDIETSDKSTVIIVERFVLVIESILSRRKLKNAINGSRCCTSALTAKRISCRIVST